MFKRVHNLHATPGGWKVSSVPRWWSPGKNLRVCIPLGGSEMHVPVLPSLISVSWNVSDLKVLDERPEGTAALAAGEAASAAAVREHAEVLLVADLSGGDGAMLEVPTVQRVSNVSLQEMVFVVSPIAVAHTKALLDWSPITSRREVIGLQSRRAFVWATAIGDTTKTIS